MAIDKMEYDAVALGNHEFDWGLENMIDPDGTLLDYEYEGQNYANEVPVVCANIYQNGTRLSSTKDYVIVEKTATNSQGGEVKVRIGVIGLAEFYQSLLCFNVNHGRNPFFLFVWRPSSAVTNVPFSKVTWILHFAFHIASCAFHVCQTNSCYS